MSAPGAATARTHGAETLTLGMLSTYPPTRCGLATFAAALERERRAQGHVVRIVRACDVPDEDIRPSGSIPGTLQPGSWRSRYRAALALSTNDVAIIHHDFGIYGDTDGEETVAVMRMLRTPGVLVLHAAPATPSPHRAAIRVVVMTGAARVRQDSAVTTPRLLSRTSRTRHPTRRKGG